jgi:ATP-binding cassette subfamily B protein
MRKKLKLFRDSLKLVWQSAPGWASATIVIPLARSIFPLIFIWLIRNIIDNITSVSAGAATPSFSKTFLPVIVLSAVWFLDEAFGSLAIFAGKKQSFLLEKHMYDLLHAKAAGIDLINFEHPEYFDVLARASREAPWRPNSILNHLIMLTRGLLSLLIMTGVLLKLNAALAILLIFINIPGVWMRVHYSGILYNFKRQQTPEMRKASYFNWILTGDRPSRELRLFGLGNYFMELFRKSFHSQNEEEINIIRKRTSIELISHFFKAAALLLILLYVSARTIDGSITVGEMAMFLLAYRQGMVYAKEVMTSLGGLYEDSLFVADTFEFLNLGENIKSQASAATFTELKKKITVKNLSFRYPGSKSATINNLSFEINRGEIIAIVGPNGAGKSTLVKLLCRLYDPESGNIMYDNTDVREIDPDEYRRQFSVIFQDFMLYNLTAGENIRLGNLQKDKTSENLRKAALQSGIDSTLNSLPAGYDTPIGNLFSDSRELSWGEWQKIALARALFRESPVLILDEPSSALDAETEYDIFSRFRQIVNGRTSILITHRFTNVSLADRIIVLDKGAIAESGTHSELMQKKGIYSRMYIRQSSRFAQ